MIEKTKKIGNPLTIVGIFAALSEIASVTAIGLVAENLQPTFIWFIMGFPILLVVLFFLTLNFNPKVLYAPSDYKDEKHFITTLQGFNQNKTLSTVKQITEVKNQIFNHERVEVDGKKFISCQFINCNIVFKGTGDYVSADCSFDNCVWTLDEPAANVIQYLTAIYHGLGGTGKNLVEATFNQIRSGEIKRQ